MRRRLIALALLVLAAVWTAPIVGAQGDGLAIRVPDDPARAGPGEEATWTIVVVNRGDATRNVSLSTSQDVQQLGGSFEPGQLQVPANGTAQATFRLTVPQGAGAGGAIGQRVGVPVSASADDGAQAERQLTLEIAPPSPRLELVPSSPVALIVLVGLPIGLAYAFHRDASPTFVFAASILLIFFVQLFTREFAGFTPLQRELALRPYLFARGGQWWAIVTHMFLHAGFMHIVGNLILLVLLGPRLESYISERNFVLLYLGAGLAGGVASIALFGGEPTRAGLAANLGASGAIFGVLAAFAMRLPKERIPIPIGIMIFIPAYIAFPLYMGFQIFLIFSQNNVAWWAHLAGAAVGAAFAYFWKPEKPDALTYETVEADPW